MVIFEDTRVSITISIQTGLTELRALNLMRHF